jgi:hypothetical protein
MKLVILVVSLLVVGTANAQKPPVYQIDFEGGTAYEFWESQLQELEINVILPDNVRSLEIPEIRLRNVTVDELFDALTIVGQNSFPITEWEVTKIGSSPLVGSNGTVINAPGERVWTLVAYNSRTAKPFSVRGLLEEFSIEEITSAIESTIQATAEAQGRSSDIEFRFHEATDLLIIIGQSADVISAGQTIDALYSSWQQ